MTIQLPAKQFKKYLRLKAQENAAKRQAEQIKESFNLPEMLHVSQEGEKQEIVIVNGNRKAMGKLTVYWYSGAVIPANWRQRIS